jgi:hypothetical protein
MVPGKRRNACPTNAFSCAIARGNLLVSLNLRLPLFQKSDFDFRNFFHGDNTQ